LSEETESSQAQNEAVQRIDVMHLGRPRVICCHRFGDVLVDPGPTTSIEHVIESLGDIEPRAVLLTHIHLDHAGGTGALVRRFPDLEVYVHSIGAPHMVDPSRLVPSARRVFGDLLEPLWGEVIPVPEQNVRAIEDGDVVYGLTAILTPGHSGHHVCFLHEDSGVALVGDMVGQTVETESRTILSTPPPEIDLELWADSVRRVMSFAPTELGLTHFGHAGDPERQAEMALEELARVGERSRDGDQESVVAYLNETLDSMDELNGPSVRQATPPLEQLWLGLERYWRKKMERSV